ncbi:MULTISPECIES: patatin-like phospholipase family protein [Salegentibacter]|jgi:predicted patatin/cPLA2 family phospholipase|uniref:Patatin n=2 Tax=Salegentibacter TaxID=143222 RepID=A0A0Q9ZHV4_9FLAO|nr:MULTISPECIES: patatin-like phospholipase family protein [Salegentibacter]KRG28343.1 patatin [Salegentibacter mishustinae]MDX1426419.1 patatin-like phospholipase family protein [Salegentibacter mishustinae]MDX1720331.1 patatin-like phospholipase family protein [Salegentibacter mishustinae]OEY73455.1 patatin [Salegentibacter salarius]PKD20493.1 patatin [Salegentibacter salarius]|tara:strand:+ start:588 stop:1511 length:924 start_codon:yes stop_codon:yes gene_type:complete
MRALVISGGGSKGAFAGGVAQYLIQEEGKKYDLFLGTSTGSLLIPHLAMGNIDKVYDIYTNVNQRKIFNVNPFVVKRKEGREYVTINYFNMFWQFVRKKRTFGESQNLRKHIKRNFSEENFDHLKNQVEDVVVTVSNLSKNRVEYKSINDFTYEDFCDWIWISCNYIPFMSLAKKDGFEYADGGLGCVVPIREAIKRGATEVDAIILEAENMEYNKVLGKNPFSLMINLFGFLLDQVEYHDIVEGKLAALNKKVKLNTYYTPTKLTENSLVFNKKLMGEWWQQGYDHAKEKHLQYLATKRKGFFGLF